MIRNRGFAQIPLMISLLVLAIALPALSRVVKQSQDTRNRATSEVCVIVPPELIVSEGECSTFQGCAKMVSVGVSDTAGVRHCKIDCACPEIVGGDNAFCGECRLPISPTEIPTEAPPVTLTPTTSPTPTCDPSACDSEYDCLLDRKCNITNIVACEKCSPATESAKKKNYCTSCDVILPTITPTSTPSATPTPVVYCTPVPCPTGGKYACPTGSCLGGCGMVCVTPTEVPVVTPGECKMPVVEDYFSIKFDKMIPEVDIVFAFDTTGSMSSLIKKAKEKGLELLKGLDEKLGDKARFAVVDFRDYDVLPYGAPGDYPYKLDVDLTDDKDKVMNGINGLTIGNGKDLPESYLTVMHNVKDLKWRDGAKKILIFLADSVEHNPEVDGSGSITTAGEIENFKKAGISLLYLNVDNQFNVTKHWKEVSEKIGNGSGAFGVASITTSSTDFVEVIMKLVVGVVRNIDKLYLNANPDKYLPWLKYTAMVGVTIPVEGTEIKFPYSIEPLGMTNGTYNLVVELMGDKTLYATKSASVVVVGCPGDCGKLEQVCCVNSAGDKYCDVGLGCDPDSGKCKKACGKLDQVCCVGEGEGDVYCDEGLDCDLEKEICKKACPPCKAIGDYSCDGTVNGLDYSWWKQEFVDKLKHDGKWEASYTCSEVVGPEDFSAWRNSYLN